MSSYSSNVVNECGPDPKDWSDEIWNRICINGSCCPKSSNTVYAFVNLKRSHWVLLQIERLKNCGTIFDSNSRPMGLNMCRPVFNNLVKYLFDANNWKLNISSKIKQQTSLDCGVFCMLMLKKLALYSELDIDTSPSKIMKERKIFTLEILTERL